MSSKGPSTVTLSPSAYGVLFLHALKHPHRTINGLLLGSADASPGGTVTCTECLPLFHSPLALAPMLEAALLLADEYCQASGKQIVGYYQANELCDDLDLGPYGKKIAEKIRSQCASACCLLLDGAKMRPSPSDLKLICLAADGKRYGVTPTIAPDAEAAVAAVERAIGKAQQHEIVDFDAVRAAAAASPRRARPCRRLTRRAAFLRVLSLYTCLTRMCRGRSPSGLSLVSAAAPGRREQGLARERGAARGSERDASRTTRNVYFFPPTCTHVRDVWCVRCGCARRVLSAVVYGRSRLALLSPT